MNEEVERASEAVEVKTMEKPLPLTDPSPDPPLPDAPAEKFPSIDSFPPLMKPAKPLPVMLVKKTAKKKNKNAQTIVVDPPVRLPSQGGAIRPPPRPGPGKAGREISLSANHFGVTIKSPTIFHYAVDIKPDLPKPLFK